RTPTPALFPYTTLFRSRTWTKTLAGLDWLAASGFKIAIAGRTCWAETEAEARAGYGRLIAERGWPVDPAKSGELVLLPEMDGKQDRKSTRLNSSHLGIS